MFLRLLLVRFLLATVCFVILLLAVNNIVNSAIIIERLETKNQNIIRGEIPKRKTPCCHSWRKLTTHKTNH